MGTVYDLSASGDLTEDVLRRAAASEVNSLNAEFKLTPLGVAVWHGRVECAKLLLKYNADPDGGRAGRPPLWVATLKTPDRQAEALIQILLEHNASAALASQVAGDMATTPLWNAVQTRKSPDVISRLVDAGAVPNATVPAENKSAWQLAKTANDQARLSAMRPREERTSDRVAQTALVVALIGAIVFWSNNNINVSAAAGVVTVAAAGAAAGAVAASGTNPKDAILGRFNMSGWLDDRFAMSTPGSVNDGDEAAKAEFKKHIRTIISENQLDHFFPKDSEFLKKVVDGAVRLDRDPSNLLNPKDLVHLALYKPILYCDDSQSMTTKTGKKVTRMNDQMDLVQRIASITTRIIPDGEGADLRFINMATDKAMSNPSTDYINTVLSNAPLYGHWSEIGTNLKTKVLEPALYEPLRQDKLTRPLLISILTDGCPAGPEDTPEKPDTLKNAIEECGQALQTNGFPRKSVRFQISQIGADAGAEEFLRLLGDSGLDDVLHVSSDQLDEKFRKFNNNKADIEQWLLQLLMSGIMYAQAA